MSAVVSHYRILRKLGSGGMGDVFLAEDEQLHRQVALKMLRPECGSDPHQLRRFVREALAASALTHPNVAVIYEAGETAEKTHFIAMEYVTGDRLDSLLARGPLPADLIVELGAEIADALDEAHSKGIVHRDLKPSNVLVDSRGHAKVLDFGLAKMTVPSAPPDIDASTVSRTAPGLILGTVPYMSPEQALGHAVDHRSDIFSFGALLYQMATGQRPFPGVTSTEVAEAIIHGQPKAIAQLNYEIPEELDRVIRKCMEKSPDARYQSAREIVVDLRNLRRDRSGRQSTVPLRIKRGAGRWIMATAGLLAVAIAAWLAFTSRVETFNAAPVDSLAVLPFVNADSQTEYLSDGITTSVIDSLAQLPQLKVMSRTSVFRFKGQNVDAQEIGRRLKVRAIVSGRVQQVGDRVTIGAEMLDVRDGHQLWGRQYDRLSGDLFSIQGEIARDISEELRIKLTGAQRQRLTKRYTTDPEAYALYLKGRYYANQRTPDALRRSIDFFRQAIEKDPGYALAYVGLGDCYSLMPELAGGSTAEWHDRARAAIQTALRLDDSIAEAYVTLGFIEHGDWQLETAMRQFRRAIELNPSYASAHHWYTITLCSAHRSEEGLAEIRKAQRLDPLSPVINMTAGFVLFARGNDVQAVQELKSVTDLDPTFGWSWTYLGSVYVARGQCQTGIDSLRKGADLTGRSPYALARLAYGLARCGDRKGAEKIASELTGRGASSDCLALVSVGLGDTDSAFEHLEAAYRDHDPQLANLSWEPEFRVLRSDPRYLDLTRRIGIPP